MDSMLQMCNKAPNYNAKIDVNGNYTEYDGWSVIAHVETDLTWLYNFIQKHNTLNQFFSPLPKSSHHMTLYNIWSNGSVLTPHQKDFLLKNFSQSERSELEKQSRNIGFFNPDGCINGLLFRLHYEVSKYTQKWKPLKVKIKKIKYNGNCIRLSIKNSDNLETLNYIRGSCIIATSRDDQMGEYHVTLAYKFKNIDKSNEEKIKSALDDMNALLENQTITLKAPFVCHFKDMTEFKPFDDSLVYPVDRDHFD